MGNQKGDGVGSHMGTWSWGGICQNFGLKQETGRWGRRGARLVLCAMIMATKRVKAPLPTFAESWSGEATVAISRLPIWTGRVLSSYPPNRSRCYPHREYFTCHHRQCCSTTSASPSEPLVISAWLTRTSLLTHKLILTTLSTQRIVHKSSPGCRRD